MIRGLHIPREHGAWSVLVSALLAGTVVGRGWHAASLVFAAAILAGFIGWENLCRRSFSWAAALLAASAAGFLWLVAGKARYDLIPLMSAIGACAVITWVLAGTHKARSFAAEWLGLAGLSLIAAAAEYAASGRFTARTFGVWLVCASVFTGSLFHVRYRVRSADARRRAFGDRLRAGLPALAYHGAALGAAACLALAGLVPAVAAWLLVPGLLRVAWSVARRAEPGPVRIKAVGYAELAFAAFFLILIALTAGAWA